MLVENVKVALRALAANKLRSVLTTLGIIIGVTAVIALVSLGNGVQRFINQRFESQGANLIFVLPARVERGGANRSGVLAFQPGARTGTALSLTYADALALRDPERVPDAKIVAPIVSGQGKLVSGARKYETRVRGTVPEYRELNNAPVRFGRYIAQDELISGARVVVLGDVPYRKLFPEGGDPVGEEVRINNIPFRVVGVMAQRVGGQEGSDDDVVVVPITTAQERLFPQRNVRGEPTVGIILVQAVSRDRIDAAMQQITDLLRERHNIQFAGEDDFSVASQRDLLNTVGAVTGAVTIFLAAIAGISLFVGGIGIMNIMLVSVTERTREIGLRKAIGARKRVILQQFLIESTTLSLLGGAIGIVLGVSLAHLVALFSQGQFSAVVTFDAVAMAVGFSTAVGILFGMYPAWRAAQLSPIAALRYE
ncbi:MAG: ABC transporter permease [Thermoflexales bacterium]|nr:ABC transporter permease [Thermoflexales bacterium]